LFKHLSTLNDLSAVALAAGMVDKTHTCINIVSIEGQRTGFTESSVVQTVVGKSLHLVITHRVRHLAGIDYAT
jgi:hypothetical protein